MWRGNARGTARRSALDEIGDRDAEPGSRPWAVYFSFVTKQARHKLDGEVKELTRLIGYLKEHEAWKALGYPSFGLMAERECDLSGDDLDRLETADPKQSIGVALGPRPGPAPGSMTTAARQSTPIDANRMNKCKSQGTTIEYLAARLERDRPDIVERMRNGEFRSIRAAAREAGIVRPTAMIYTDDPAAAARAIRRHFRGERLAALIAFLQED